MPVVKRTVKRLTKKGYKIRRTRRLNQVKAEVSLLNIGGKDSKLLTNLLSKKLTTKRGVARSKRLQELIINQKDFKKLGRFKEFRDLKTISDKKLTTKTLTRLLEDDSAFYVENNELIEDYNKLTKKQKKDRRYKTTKRLELEYSEFRAKGLKDRLE